MRKMEITLWPLALCLTLTGCGDVTVNPPSRPTTIIEEKKVIVEKPVIVEKSHEEKPLINIEKH